MVRVRIPSGILNCEQLKALSFASQKFGDGKLHLTTRQDIQIHNVKIEDTIKAIEYLKDFDLSPRGGGNTIRNIIGCSLAGVCPEEIFDIRQYPIGLSEFLLREDSSFNLPRKLKVSFSGCNKDCVGAAIADIGFLAKTLDGKRGFKVFVGGGMGAHPYKGKVLCDFLSEEDVGYCVKAIKNIFYRKGDRRDKHHNRLRFLIHDNLGFDNFKNLYEEEFKNLKEKEYVVLRKINFPSYPEVEENILCGDDEEYKQFLRYNCLAQKQKGFWAVALRVPRGDLMAKEAQMLSNLKEEFKEIVFSVTTNQNLIIRGVRGKDLYKLFLKLKDILDDFLYPNTLLDIVACKEALTCNLGLCDSPGLAKELEGLGPGECGAGIIEIIESDLSEAEVYLKEAEKKDFSSFYIKKTLALTARALLVVKGCDPKNEKEIFHYFKEKFTKERIVNQDYADVEEVFNDLDRIEEIEERKKKFNYAKSFLTHIKNFYESMDSSFNFPTQKREDSKKEKKEEKLEAKFLDLKGTPCPLNYVKAKLFLENLNSGEITELLLDEGEPINNVPKSLENDGHKILKIEKIDGFYRVVVEKK